MPGFNGTGPRGMGPMTGGGRGFCSPRGRGRGYGYAAGTYDYPYYGAGPAFAGTQSPLPVMDRQQELDSLRNQAQAVRSQLEEIESKIQRLTNNV